MIRNKNLCRAAKKKTITVYHDIDVPVEYSVAYLDPENPTKVTDIWMQYVVITNTGTLPGTAERINVGTPATPTLYCSVLPVASTAAGTFAKQTLASAALLPAGTALLVKRSALVGGTNTGAVLVHVNLETIDRGNERA